MDPMLLAARRTRQRNLAYFRCPRLWPLWPVLTVIRKPPLAPAEGVLFDAFHVAGVTGYSATVFLANLFTLPTAVDALLALPREVFDTPDEVYAAGWRVD